MSSVCPFDERASAIVRGSNMSHIIFRADDSIGAALVGLFERMGPRVGQRVDRLRHGHRRGVHTGRVLPPVPRRQRESRTPSARTVKRLATTNH